jgi:hypothetical protein
MPAAILGRWRAPSQVFVAGPKALPPGLDEPGHDDVRVPIVNDQQEESFVSGRGTPAEIALRPQTLDV